MQRSLQTLWPSVLLVALVGCSGSSVAPSGNTVRENIGAYPALNVVQTTEEALRNRYGFRFERSVGTGEDIYYETAWKDDSAEPDEREQGIDFVRTKITVTARPRNRTAGTASSYTTIFRAEVLSHINMTGEWVEQDLTPMRKEILDEIMTYMENELRSQFRAY